MTLTQLPSSSEKLVAMTWPAAMSHLSTATMTFDRREKLIARASGMSAARLQSAVAEAYSELVTEAAASRSPYPVRFWNYIPSIHTDMGGGLDRYRVFNAGRLDGFERAMNSTDALHGQVATASAVGHGGDDLVIHCLSADRRGRPISNPRQVDPVHYSARYGPRPPCFARATAVDSRGGSTLLFVGGTASIRGEASLHDRQLAQQLDETLTNLAAVVTAASKNVKDPLSRYTELRVYHASATVPRMLREAVAASFVNVKQPEFVRADLCRAELLVEIEGLAEL